MKDKFKSGRIKLVYWNEPNFGDMLSPYIVGKLSGQEIINKELYHNMKDCFRNLIKKIFCFKFKEISSILFWWEKNLLAVGSIISTGNKHSVVWGSGFINEKQTFKGGYVCAVRGKYTNEKLKKEGFSGANVYGDPALLMPLLISPSEFKTTDVGIIPHWSETDYFKNKYGKKYKIIDLRTKDIKRVIEEITSCRRILSTSLHGIIVSHAYGIPALWIRHNALHDSNLKFYDYFSSVGIKEYEGLTNIDEVLSSEQSYIECFNNNKEKELPNIDIKTIQRNLLSVAPFNIKNEVLAKFDL
ncbi:MAG: polysaccharide pyruvyl transferase family protein [Xylanibacter rarus]